MIGNDRKGQVYPMIEVMETKLLPLQTGNNAIERPRLQESFVQAKDQKLVLFIAAAGYGKTVAMSQFTSAIQKPALWYQLDSYDNDPVVFMQYFIVGVQNILPGFGKNILPLIEQGNINSHVRMLVTHFVNSFMTTALGIMIAFDDFHVVTNPTVLEFIQQLIENSSPNVQFVMTSRVCPPLSLTRLQVANQVTLIDTEELRFTASEIDLLMRYLKRECSLEFVKELESKIAGWPAALRFVTSTTPMVPQGLSAQDISKLYEFLAVEVFDQQPEDVRRFLLVSSVLEVMTPDNCDQLLNRKDSDQMLNLLESKQLFLISLTHKERAYKYHQLFREFLQTRLGAEKNQILGRAAKLAIQKGEYDSAVEYLIATDFTEELFPILQTAGQQAFRHGRWQTVHRWLGLLSSTQLAAHEWLAFFRAKVAVYLGRLDEAETWVAKANIGFVAKQDQLGLAENQLLQARILRCRGHYRESADLLDQAYAYFNQNETNHRFDLVLERYLIYTMTGQFKAAEELLTGALKVAELEDDSYICAHLHEALGNIYYVQGEYFKALQIYRKAEELSPDRVLPNYYMQDNIAAIYQEWGELDKAFEYAKRNVAIKENFGVTEALPSAYYQLALIHMDRAEYKQAKALFNQAIKLIKDNNGERFYLTLNTICLARCLSLEGHWIEAIAKGKEVMDEARAQSGLILTVFQMFYGAALFFIGNLCEGERLINEVAVTFEQIGFQRVLCFSYTILALCNFSKKNHKEAGEFAEKSLTLGSRKNLIQSYITYFDQIQPLLRYGLEQGIEVTFIQQVAVRRGIRAVPFLNKLAVHINSETRKRAIVPLAEIGGAKAYALIQKLTKDKDPQVREMAQMTAERLGLPLNGPVSNEVDLSFIQVKTLGNFSVLDAAKEPLVKGWRTTKARDLLAYFIHQVEPVAIDRILEDLWPEMPRDKSSANFHTTLYQLRQTLIQVMNCDLIGYSDKRYYLLPNSFFADRKNFEELTAKGLHSKIISESIEYLKEAFQVYSGDYLVELDYAWVLPTQEHLKQLYQEIQKRLVHYYLEKKEYPQVIHYLRILISMDPYSEEFYCLLMSAYAGLGDRVAIKEQYQALTKILDEELGLEPERETQELYKKLVC
jgi:LuxR family maltose regulon positive regulatory protein